MPKCFVLLAIMMLPQWIELACTFCSHPLAFLAATVVEAMPSMRKEAASVESTKIFVGGITRGTTTKMLREHFAQFGRVSDCVAMRKADGSSRGFGYVTFDSPDAVNQCLSAPQLIDDRVVDLKRAVPEAAGENTAWPKSKTTAPAGPPGFLGRDGPASPTALPAGPVFGFGSVHSAPYSSMYGSPYCQGYGSSFNGAYGYPTAAALAPYVDPEFQESGYAEAPVNVPSSYRTPFSNLTNLAEFADGIGKQKAGKAPLAPSLGNSGRGGKPATRPHKSRVPEIRIPTDAEFGDAHSPCAFSTPASVSMMSSPLLSPSASVASGRPLLPPGLPPPPQVVQAMLTSCNGSSVQDARFCSPATVATTPGSASASPIGRLATPPMVAKKPSAPALLSKALAQEVQGSPADSDVLQDLAPPSPKQMCSVGVQAETCDVGTQLDFELVCPACSGCNIWR